MQLELICTGEQGFELHTVDLPVTRIQDATMETRVHEAGLRRGWSNGDLLVFIVHREIGDIEPYTVISKLAANAELVRQDLFGLKRYPYI